MQTCELHTHMCKLNTPPDHRHLHSVKVLLHANHHYCGFASKASYVAWQQHSLVHQQSPRTVRLTQGSVPGAANLIHNCESGITFYRKPRHSILLWVQRVWSCASFAHAPMQQNVSKKMVPREGICWQCVASTAARKYQQCYSGYPTAA